MCIVGESREEAFDVFFADGAGDQLLTALVNYECFKVVDREVVVDVAASLFFETGLECSLILKLPL